MYNLQKAKEEIDAVAKHATDLTEYVIAIGDVLQTLSSSLEGKLEGIRRELHGLMDGKLNEVKQSVLGNDGPLFETAAIADLGARLSALKTHGSVLAAREQAAPDSVQPPHQAEAHPGDRHPAEPPHEDAILHPTERPHDDYHGGHFG